MDNSHKGADGKKKRESPTKLKTKKREQRDGKGEMISVGDGLERKG